jgi:hypothetical protein
MIDSLPPWLLADVPLYAFLLALLTSPWRWAGYAKRVMKRFAPGGDDAD